MNYVFFSKTFFLVFLSHLVHRQRHSCYEIGIEEVYLCSTSLQEPFDI